MTYLKIKSILPIILVALFITSCEREAVNNNLTETNELSELFEDNSKLIEQLSSDQSFKGIFDQMLTVSNNDEKVLALFNTYFDNDLLQKYPEFSKMSKDEAMKIVFEAVSQLETGTIDSRCTHCMGGCHYCCLAQSIGGGSWCGWRYCPYGLWCR